MIKLSDLIINDVILYYYNGDSDKEIEAQIIYDINYQTRILYTPSECHNISFDDITITEILKPTKKIEFNCYEKHQ